jgi:hypothetical protein
MIDMVCSCVGRAGILQLMPIVLLTASTATGGNAQAGGARYVLVQFAEDQPRIASHGVVAQPRFRTLFLESYAVAGERTRAPSEAIAAGVLVVTTGVRVISLNVMTWKTADGRTLFLCRGGEDGQPPAFFVATTSWEALVDRTEATLRMP